MIVPSVVGPCRCSLSWRRAVEEVGGLRRVVAAVGHELRRVRPQRHRLHADPVPLARLAGGIEHQAGVAGPRVRAGEHQLVHRPQHPPGPDRLGLLGGLGERGRRPRAGRDLLGRAVLGMAGERRGDRLVARRALHGHDVLRSPGAGRRRRRLRRLLGRGRARPRRAHAPSPHHLGAVEHVRELRPHGGRGVLVDPVADPQVLARARARRAGRSARGPRARTRSPARRRAPRAAPADGAGARCRRPAARPAPRAAPARRTSRAARPRAAPRRPAARRPCGPGSCRRRP